MKRCGRCKVEQDDSEFPIRDARTGRVHTICKACRRGYCRSWYGKNRIAYNAHKRVRVKACRARNRQYVDEYLSTHPCVDCGLLNPLVMEFDHVVGTKINDISTLVREGASMRVLLAEIAKCVVRCANCHRARTAVTLWGKKLPSAAGFPAPGVPVTGSRGDCSSVG